MRPFRCNTCQHKLRSTEDMSGEVCSSCGGTMVPLSVALEIDEIVKREMPTILDGFDVLLFQNSLITEAERRIQEEDNGEEDDLLSDV